MYFKRTLDTCIKNELFHGTSLLPPISRRYDPKRRYLESRVHSNSKINFFQNRSGELRIKG